MPDTTETDLREVIEILIDIRARQAAILNLLHEQGADPLRIHQGLQNAVQRIHALPAVETVLSKSALPPHGQLAKALRLFPWGK
jgi:hypothetical protein